MQCEALTNLIYSKKNIMKSCCEPLWRLRSKKSMHRVLRPILNSFQLIDVQYRLDLQILNINHEKTAVKMNLYLRKKEVKIQCSNRGTVIMLESPPPYAFAIKKHVNNANIPMIISGKCFVLFITHTQRETHDILVHIL